MDIKKLNEKLNTFLPINETDRTYPQYTKDEIIKASSMLKAIANNSKALDFSDSATLLKASVILVDNLDKFLLGESYNQYLEGVSPDAINYGVDKLGDNYKVAGLSKYGQINNDKEYKKVIDKEAIRLDKQMKKRLQNVRAFMNSLAKKKNARLDERYYAHKTNKIKTGSPQYAYFFNGGDDIINYDPEQPEPEIIFDDNDKVVKAISLRKNVYTL